MHEHVRSLTIYLSLIRVYFGPNCGQIRSAFRKHFIDKLSTHYEDLNNRESLNELIEDLMARSWCVHAEPPTANTKIIQEYLGRYICRIGLSKNRFHYDEVNQQVTLSFKDYMKRNADYTKVPTGIKNLEPMVAIDQIMALCLPPNFQKCRYYGLHATATYPKVSADLPTSI